MRKTTYGYPAIHRLCILLFALSVAAAVYAGEPLKATKVFADIPLDVLDMIRPSTRLDMIDYHEQADSLLTAQDALGGECRLEAVCDDWLRLRVSPVSTLEIKILPLGNDSIVMTLYTVGGDGAADDTQIRFFDSGLKELDARKFLRLPAMKDFFSLKDSGIDVRKLREMLPFSAVRLSTGPDDSHLTARFTTVDVLPQESAEILRPLLKEKRYVWSGKGYKADK